MAHVPLRLLPGDDLRRTLESYALRDAAGAAFVLAGIGSLGSACLRMAGSPEETTIDGPLELLTLSGTLSRDGAHLHASVSDAQGRVSGGHLGYGNPVRTTCEVLVEVLEGWTLARAWDPLTSYRELVIKPTSRPGLENGAASAEPKLPDS